jgi:hypothetical protein
MPKESREAIEKRVLEAQKVVVSNFLYEWKRKYGMDYIIIVRNKPGEVFTRSSVSKKNGGAEEMTAAVDRVKSRL